MISLLSSYVLPWYSPFQTIGLPGLQSVETLEPNMYSLIWSGSVRASQTFSSGASISAFAVATWSAMSSSVSRELSAVSYPVLPHPCLRFTLGAHAESRPPEADVRPAPRSPRGLGCPHSVDSHRGGYRGRCRESHEVQRHAYVCDLRADAPDGGAHAPLLARRPRVRRRLPALQRRGARPRLGAGGPRRVAGAPAESSPQASEDALAGAPRSARGGGRARRLRADPAPPLRRRADARRGSGPLQPVGLPPDGGRRDEEPRRPQGLDRPAHWRQRGDGAHVRVGHHLVPVPGHPRCSPAGADRRSGSRHRRGRVGVRALERALRRDRSSRARPRHRVAAGPTAGTRLTSMATATSTASAKALLERLGVDSAFVTDGDVVVRTPITGDEIARLARTSERETAAAVARAVAGFEAWRDVPAPRRGELVRLLGEELRREKESLGALV